MEECIAQKIKQRASHYFAAAQMAAALSLSGQVVQVRKRGAGRPEQGPGPCHLIVTQIPTYTNKTELKKIISLNVLLEGN